MQHIIQTDYPSWLVESGALEEPELDAYETFNRWRDDVVFSTNVNIDLDRFLDNIAIFKLAKGSSMDKAVRDAILTHMSRAGY